MANHPLQSSGQITLNDISMEFNRTNGILASLNDAKSGVYGAINLASIVNPVTGNNSTTGQPKNGLHITDWYGYNHNASDIMNFGSGFDNPVYDITLLSDGKILMGGVFTSYKGVVNNRIIKLNMDGSPDTVFKTNVGTGYNNLIQSIPLQSDGKILVGGAFTTYSGVTRNSGMRLNNDGTVDTNYSNALGTAFNFPINDIAIQTDGKSIYVGSFSSLNGAPRYRLVRLNTDGSEDIDFNLDVGSGFNFASNRVTIQADGKILIGGTFTLFNGATRNRLVRLNTDGSEDIDFKNNIGTGFSDTVSVIGIQSDGKILIGGDFIYLNGTSRRKLVRLNDNGTVDTDFYSKLGTGFNSSVRAILVQSDGKILVGGGFTTLNGITRNKLVRLNADGTVDTDFYSKLGIGFNNDVMVMTIQPTGKILAGGSFTTLNSVTRNRICQLDIDGTPLA